MTSGHTELTVSASGRRVKSADNLYGFWTLIPDEEAQTPPLVERLPRPHEPVLVVTDHDWLIDYMSSGAQRLIWVPGSGTRNLSLLGLVHPSVASAFLSAAARASVERVAVHLTSRWRVASDHWADRYCTIRRMCEHDPPRLGLVITEGSAGTTGRPPDPRPRRQDRHVALGAHAKTSLDTLRAIAMLRESKELSARQSEVVAHLASGQRVQDIARETGLSPSTVRNHLAAIFRKFGVHSQPELLAALLRAAARQNA